MSQIPSRYENGAVYLVCVQRDAACHEPNSMVQLGQVSVSKFPSPDRSDSVWDDLKFAIFVPWKRFFPGKISK